MEGMDEAEEDHYFNNHPKIILLFEVDILQTLTPYIEDKEDDIQVDEQTLKEIRLQQEAIKKEMQVSQRVQALAHEELNLADAGTEAESKTVLIANKNATRQIETFNEMLQAKLRHHTYSNLLRQYKMSLLGHSKT